MNILDRAIYAAFLLVVLVGAAGMVSMILGYPDTVESLFSPWFAVPVFVLGLVLAPWMARWLPFKRK